MVGAALNEKFKILYRFLKILNRAQQQCSICLELDIENDFQFLNFLCHIIVKVLASQKQEKKTEEQCISLKAESCWKPFRMLVFNRDLPTWTHEYYIFRGLDLSAWFQVFTSRYIDIDSFWKLQNRALFISKKQSDEKLYFQKIYPIFWRNTTVARSVLVI